MQALIVDDDIAIVEAIAGSLNWEKLGVTKVYTSYSIQTAKQILLSKNIAIVISDIEMPGGNGLELLEWFRKQNQEGEFLLLTCHEKFDYAVNAVKMHATEYLLKPFDVTALENALKKCIINIKVREQQKKNRKWLQNNMENVRKGTLERLLREDYTEELFDSAIKNAGSHLFSDKRREYILLISRITETQKAEEQFGKSILAFILMNIQTESLFGVPKTEQAVCFEDRGEMISVVFCEKEEEGQLAEKCRCLQENCRRYTDAIVTLCISQAYTAEHFHEAYLRIAELLFSEVTVYGKIFLENHVPRQGAVSVSIQEAESMKEFLLAGKKNAFLNQVKQEISRANVSGHLNKYVLANFKQEILQIIYSYLSGRGISASHLFGNQVAGDMEKKAVRSVLDMLRWVSYMLDRIFIYEEELANSGNIIRKIDEYIRQNYAQHIGRNEIAAEFFLTPEYLSKMYKRKTGISLKDAINEFRIQQAKIFLSDGRPVSDVAADVGFDNFSYFSTLFRKYTGTSPSEYRKMQKTSF